MFGEPHAHRPVRARSRTCSRHSPGGSIACSRRAIDETTHSRPAVRPLQPAVAGQHVVGELRGRRHHVLVDHEQVLRHQASEMSFMLAKPISVLLPSEKNALTGIRLRRPAMARKTAGGIGHVGAERMLAYSLAPHALGRLAQRRRAAVGEGGVAVGAELLGLLRIGQAVVQLEVALGTMSGQKPVEHLAAGHVEVAGQRAQGAVQADRRGAVALLVGDRRPRDDAGPWSRTSARRARISSASTPVMAATRSSGYSATRSVSSSNPTVHCSTKSRS